MVEQQQFCLRWNNHGSTLVAVFDNLLASESLVDVTLFAEGKLLKAHKVVLSACSPYFQQLFAQTTDKHPIVILKDVKHSELKALLDYMYRGEVNVSQDQLGPLIKTAESLKIKGLADGTNKAAPGHVPEPQPAHSSSNNNNHDWYKVKVENSHPEVSKRPTPGLDSYPIPPVTVPSVLSTVLTMPPALSLASSSLVPNLKLPNLATTTVMDPIPREPRDLREEGDSPQAKRRKKIPKKSESGDSGDSDARSSSSPGDGMHLPRIPATITPINPHLPQQPQLPRELPLDRDIEKEREQEWERQREAREREREQQEIREQEMREQREQATRIPSPENLVGSSRADSIPDSIPHSSPNLARPYSDQEHNTSTSPSKSVTLRADENSSDANHNSDEDCDSKMGDHGQEHSDAGPSTSRLLPEDAPHTPNYLGWPYPPESSSNDESFPSLENTNQGYKKQCEESGQFLHGLDLANFPYSFTAMSPYSDLFKRLRDFYFSQPENINLQSVNQSISQSVNQYLSQIITNSALVNTLPSEVTEKSRETSPNPLALSQFIAENTLTPEKSPKNNSLALSQFLTNSALTNTPPSEIKEKSIENSPNPLSLSQFITKNTQENPQIHENPNEKSPNPLSLSQFITKNPQENSQIHENSNENSPNPLSLSQFITKNPQIHENSPGPLSLSQFLTKTGLNNTPFDEENSPDPEKRLGYPQHSLGLSQFLSKTGLNIAPSDEISPSKKSAPDSHSITQFLKSGLKMHSKMSELDQNSQNPLDLSFNSQLTESKGYNSINQLNNNDTKAYNSLPNSLTSLKQLSHDSLSSLNSSETKAYNSLPNSLTSLKQLSHDSLSSLNSSETKAYNSLPNSLTSLKQLSHDSLSSLNPSETKAYNSLNQLSQLNNNEVYNSLNSLTAINNNETKYPPFSEQAFDKPQYYSTIPSPTRSPIASSSSNNSQRLLYTCWRCGKAYGVRRSLHRHLKFECGVEPKFTCPVCHKKCSHKFNLKQHMTSHTKYETKATEHSGQSI